MKQLVGTNSFIIFGGLAEWPAARAPSSQCKQRPSGQHAGATDSHGQISIGRSNELPGRRPVCSWCADHANKPTRSSRSTFQSGGHNEADAQRRITIANMARVNKRINKTPINEKINEKVIKTAYSNIRDQNKRLDRVLDRVLGGHSEIDYFSTLQCFIFVSLTVVAFVSAQLGRAKARLSDLSISQRLARKLHRSARQQTPRRWLRSLIILNGLLGCGAIKNQYNKAVGAVPGDLVLGALFPVHHAPGPGN